MRAIDLYQLMSLFGKTLWPSLGDKDATFGTGLFKIHPSVHVKRRIFPEHVGGSDQDIVRHRARRHGLAGEQPEGERQHVMAVAVHVVGNRTEHYAAAVVGARS